jgi:phosphoribosylformylglycinamidine synthase
VYVKLVVPPARVPVLAGLPAGAVIPAWASHGEGRLAASAGELDRLERDGHIAFVYCDARGERVAAPNGSARNAAALTNVAGNVLAIMPHPERAERAIYAPSGGIAFFGAFAAGLTGTLA